MYSKICLLLLTFTCSITSRSQNFDYVLNKDSSLYTPLSTYQVVFAGEDFKNKNFQIYIPFQFNFCSVLCDSITVESNGFLVFNVNTQLAITAFNSFSSNKDTNNNYVSSIVYSIEGIIGNRILKIEYKNLSRYKVSVEDNITYQVWLYENSNKIEFRIGTNSYAHQPETFQSVLMGFINRNSNSDPKAFLIKGISSHYIAETVSIDSDLIYLDNIPFEGVILRLTPTF